MRVPHSGSYQIIFFKDYLLSCPLPLFILFFFVRKRKKKQQNKAKNPPFNNTMIYDDDTTLAKPTNGVTLNTNKNINLTYR